MALEALRNVIKHNPGRLKTELPQYTLLWTALKTLNVCSLYLPVRKELFFFLTDFNIVGKPYKLAGFFPYLENTVSKCSKILG